MQQIPWLHEPAEWDEIFTAQQASSPDMARSAREWRLLRESMTTISDFGPSNASSSSRDAFFLEDAG